MKSRRLTGALTLACCIAASCPAAAQLSGTLFTSPEQREYLDYLRQDFLARSSERGFDISDDEIPEIPVAIAEAAEAEGPVIYTLGGIVSLRDGTQRIWLNGKALGEAELPREARLVRADGQLALRFSTGDRTYLLHPGQTLDLTAGSLVENYEYVQSQAASEESLPPVPEVAADTAAAEVEQVQPAGGDSPEAPTAAIDQNQAQNAGIDALQARLKALEAATFGEPDDE